MTELEQIIRREIARTGPIPFARFMELALYCPKLGYYERIPRRIGGRGDYYTSVSTGCFFGELLAFQAAAWTPMRVGDRCQWVEVGAHDGRLAADMLAWVLRRRPKLLEQLQYWIIEPSAERRARQEALLEEFAGCVHWWESLDSLPHPIDGVLFSNELLDAMPVIRLGWDAAARRWFEWRVTAQAEHFAWARHDLASPQVAELLRDSGVQVDADVLAVLPAGFILDVSPEAGRWWRSAAERLGAGRLMTFDYGLTADQFLAPDHSGGTLRAYRLHHSGLNLLADAGEQDLTAHVNFTQLQRAGEAAGLRTETLTSQERFLTEIARRTWEPDADFGEWSRPKVRQFQTLTHPEHLGRSFKVLVQSR